MMLGLREIGFQYWGSNYTGQAQKVNLAVPAMISLPRFNWCLLHSMLTNSPQEHRKQKKCCAMLMLEREAKMSRRVVVIAWWYT